MGRSSGPGLQLEIARGYTSHACSRKLLSARWRLNRWKNIRLANLLWFCHALRGDIKIRVRWARWQARLCKNLVASRMKAVYNFRELTIHLVEALNKIKNRNLEQFNATGAPTVQLEDGIVDGVLASLFGLRPSLSLRLHNRGLAHRRWQCLSTLRGHWQR